MPKIVLSGGGTGGHITPLLNCARALKHQDKSLELHIYSEKGPLSEELFKNVSWRVHYIQAGKLRRYMGEGFWQRATDYRTIGANIFDIFKFGIGFFQSFLSLWQLKPAVVFVKGGYVGLPIGLAAWTLGIPLIVHESDAKAGLTNRVLAHLARVVAVGWPTEYYPKWQHKKLVHTGNLTISRPGSKAMAEKFFKFSQTQKPTILVMGGSSGARILNDAVITHQNELLDLYNLIHITGKTDYRRVVDRMGDSNQSGYRAYDYLNQELGLAYTLADVIVSRAGANTLAEIIEAGKPSIIVPYRYATGAHQEANADIMSEHDATEVIREPELNKKLVSSLRLLINDKQKIAVLGKNLRRLHVPNSSDKLAREIIGLV